MKYRINKNVLNIINRFYRNVAKRYRNTWTIDDVKKYALTTKQSIYQIENGLIRRKPTISRWDGMYMATSADRRWNFAYRIDGDTIYVEDACHAQNMHEAIQTDRITPKMRLRRLIENMVRQVISEIR